MKQQIKQDIFYKTLATVLGFSSPLTFKKIHFPSDLEEDYEPVIRQIARESQFRVRKLKLHGEWWKSDNGALLGYYKGSPCALLPKNAGYQCISFQHDAELIVDVHEKNVNEFGLDVFYFYSTFTQKLKKNIYVLKPALSIIKKDFLYMASTFFIIMLLNFLFPFGSGLLIEEAIIHNDLSLFYQIFLGLSIIGIASILMELSQMIVMVRVGCKLQLATMPAVWDRLLRLPMKFFFKYSQADVQMQMNATKMLDNYFNYTLMISLFEGAFSFFSLFILLYYSAMIGLITLGVVLITAAIVVLLNMALMKNQYKGFPYQNKLYHTVLQMIHGLEKLKSTSSEPKIFSRWFKLFHEKLNIERRTMQLQRNLEVLMKIVNIAGMGMILLFTMLMGKKMSVTDFVIINSAFMYFLSGTLGFFQAGSEVLEIFPYLNLLSPVLKTETEDEEVKNSPGILQGHIELKNINFRYQKSQPPVLRKVNIEIMPGECVAIVGESGSGKSTLLKILLGFLKPDEGYVAYDGINLHHLNILEVRSQIGTVIQSAKLIPGSIFDNIAGGQLHFSRDDAMQIIHDLGFERMIEALPMGLNTPVGSGVNTFSGGETQLIQLASLLGKRPSIVFLDEATSALDNATQKKIQHFFKTYKNTQFIIAHRLSTIRNADRIIVMSKGEIVEEGTFDELLNREGYFKALIEAEKF